MHLWHPRAPIRRSLVRKGLICSGLRKQSCERPYCIPRIQNASLQTLFQGHVSYGVPASLRLVRQVRPRQRRDRKVNLPPHAVSLYSTALTGADYYLGHEFKVILKRYVSQTVKLIRTKLWRSGKNDRQRKQSLTINVLVKRGTERCGPVCGPLVMKTMS